MKNSRIRGIALMLTGAAVLTGCGLNAPKKWVPDRTTLEYGEDGKVTETIIDTLDQSYYSAQELSELVTAQISEYNAANGEGRIQEVQETEEEKSGKKGKSSDQTEAADPNRVELTLVYAYAADFTAFNNIPLYSGTMLGAQMEGYTFETSFYQVEKGSVTGEPVSGEEPLSHKEYQVLITDVSHAVTVPGKIRYISVNAQPVSEYSVVPIQGADETEDKSADSLNLYVIYEY